MLEDLKNVKTKNKLNDSNNKNDNNNYNNSNQNINCNKSNNSNDKCLKESEKNEYDNKYGMNENIKDDNYHYNKNDNETKNLKYFFIYNIYEIHRDIFINYFYLLLNKIIVEAVKELKLNNFLSIHNLLQLLNNYEINFNMFFWVLYDNYINIYKKI